jgi:hypothetical protein
MSFSAAVSGCPGSSVAIALDAASYSLAAGCFLLQNIRLQLQKGAAFSAQDVGAECRRPRWFQTGSGLAANWQQIQAALDKLARKLTAREMQAVNNVVDGQHRDVAEMVREFRRSKGL